MSTFVNVDNYAKAEVAFQVDRAITMMGAEMNAWVHLRQPTPLDQQTVIRMNRDTLCSLGIVDVSEGASVTIPDSSDRYMTVMVINEDGYLNRVLHDPGEHPLTVEEFGSTFVLLAARILADPTDPEDLAVSHPLQDGLTITALANRPLVHGAIRQGQLRGDQETALGVGSGFARLRADLRPKGARGPGALSHRFGGLPEDEAFYAIKAHPLPAGRFRLTVKDPPLDGFWSVSIYNKDGYFQENEYNSYSVNSVTATPNGDGSVTVMFGPESDGSDNFLYVMEGWNYAARMYRPRSAILDGTWTFPEPEPI
jgi:hypothetical protein